MYLPESGVTDCQRRGLRCTEKGDFLPAQFDFLSSKWSCVSSEGVELNWTISEEPLTDDQCSGEELASNQQSAVVSVDFLCLALCGLVCVCVLQFSSGFRLFLDQI